MTFRRAGNVTRYGMIENPYLSKYHLQLNYNQGGEYVNTAKRIALLLVIIGAINWGLIGFFQFDVVASLFGGQDSLLSRVVYALVGLSGLYAISILFDSESETASSSAGTLQYGTEFSEEDDFTALEEERPDDDFDLR